MKEEEEIFECVKTGVKNALAGNVEATMEVIASRILGVGMGTQGTVGSREDVRNIVEAQNSFGDADVSITFPAKTIHYYPPSFGVASVVYEVSVKMGEDTVKSAYIQTAAAVKEGGAWKLCLLQAVPAELSVESIESYPLKFADDTLKQLRNELQEEMSDMLNESISGGVFSIYAREPYEVKFSNDSLLEMLGYTREEFENQFSPDKSSRELFAPESLRTIDPWEEELRETQTAREQMRLKKKDGTYIWAETRSRRTRDEKGTPIYLTVAVDVTELVNLQQETSMQNEMILSSIDYAGRIQRHILPREKRFKHAFTEYAIIWKPREVVGGDVYWLRNFKQGSLLCVCDCTGHGTPGALLTMLVSSALDNIVTEENCRDTALIMCELDRCLSQTLNVKSRAGVQKKDMTEIHDGCDLAVLFVDKLGNVRISSANTRVLICNGRSVRQVKGQWLQIGEGKLQSKDEVKIIEVEGHSENCFYIASDGLYDQIGEKTCKPLGYGKVQNIILENYGKSQKEVLDEIWKAFEEHRGAQSRRDDVQMIGFRPGDRSCQ